MAFPLTAAVAGGTNVLSSILGYYGQQETNKQNRANMEYQNSWNLAQWNRENEYNSPANQMSRLQEAGLNPALMYGQGTTGNSASSAPRSGVPEYKSPMSSLAGLAQIVPTFLNAASQVQQIENLQANYAKIMQDVKLADQKTQSVELDNMKKLDYRPFWHHNARYENALLGHRANDSNWTQQMRQNELNYQRSFGLNIRRRMHEAMIDNYHSQMATREVQRDVLSAGNVRAQDAFDWSKSLRLNPKFIRTMGYISSVLDPFTDVIRSLK